MELNLKYIPRLPWELRYAIYMFIDIDTRLELLQTIQARIIRCLYHMPTTDDNINKLIDTFEKGFRIKIFWKDNENKYNVQKNILNCLPHAMYKKQGQMHEICNPIFSMLEKECTLKSIYTNEPIWSKKHTIIAKIRNCFDIIPTLYGYNSFMIQKNQYKNGQQFQIKQKTFNYEIRIKLFKFIGILNIITKDFQQQINKIDLHKQQVSIKRRFKKIILKRIIPMSNNFQRRRIKQAKIQEREQAKQAKIQEREQAKQAKIQEREHAKQAKIQEREHAKQAKIQEREQAKQAKIQAKHDAKQAKIQAKTVN
jgi:hypothetical protein